MTLSVKGTTMKSTISAKAVENQINNDINACNVLLILLQKEQDALTARDPDSLAEVIEQKTQPLAHLEASAKQRVQWSNEVPGDKPSEKWNTMLQQLAQEKIKQDWETLKKLTKECQEKNEVNGKILVRQQQVYGRLLELLRGQTKAPNLYNAMGSTTGSSHSFKLDEA